MWNVYFLKPAVPYIMSLDLHSVEGLLPEAPALNVVLLLVESIINWKLEMLKYKGIN